MRDTDLFQLALGLVLPWMVKAVNFHADKNGSIWTLTSSPAVASHARTAAPPIANKVSDAWAKAIVSFNGERGPSASKLQTLAKRCEAAMVGLQNIEDNSDDYQFAFEAIRQRSAGLRFGIFGFGKKSLQKGIIDICVKGGNATREMTSVLAQLRIEINRELSAAQDSI